MGTKMRVSAAVLVAAVIVYFVARTPQAESPTTQPDDNAEEARTQEETVPGSISPEPAVHQRPAPGTPPRVLPDAVLVGHTGGVNHAAFSPDGSCIVTTSDDGTARLWDNEGKQLAVLEGGGEIYAEFSPDGSRIVTASYNGAVRLWDSEGKQLAVLVGDGLRQAEFSPDGSRIVTSSGDGTARLWDSEGKQLAVLARGGSPYAEFSPDGTRILTASRDGTARLFRVLR